MGKVYPEEVKRKAVELYRLDEQTPYAEVGRDLGEISGETIRNLCRHADSDEGRRDARLGYRCARRRRALCG